MKIKRFVAFFIISTFMFIQPSQAKKSPISTTLKEGTYKISSEHIGYYRTMKLITPNTPVTISLLDSNGAQTLFIRLTNEKESLKIGPIKGPETLIITGDGEISLMH